MFQVNKWLRLSIISIILIFLTMSCNLCLSLDTQSLKRITPHLRTLYRLSNQA